MPCDFISKNNIQPLYYVLKYAVFEGFSSLLTYILNIFVWADQAFMQDSMCQQPKLFKTNLYAISKFDIRLGKLSFYFAEIENERRFR